MFAERNLCIFFSYSSMYFLTSVSLSYTSDPILSIFLLHLAFLSLLFSRRVIDGIDVPSFIQLTSCV